MKRFQSPTSHQVEKIDNINMTNILMLFSHRGRSEGMHHNRTRAERVFECKTCNRQFPSYQALGGHTASHKKPRLLENEKANGGIESNKPKTHECSICGLQFAIGQALGGHMRRHRAVNEGFGISSDKFVEQKCNSGKMAVLDLNFPPMDDEGEYGKLGLGLGLIC